MADDTAAERIRELAEQGAVAALSEELFTLAKKVKTWTAEPGGYLHALQPLGSADRATLEEDLKKRAKKVHYREWDHSRQLGVLAELLSRYSPDGTGLNAAHADLSEFQTQWTSYETEVLQAGIQRLQLAGETVPTAVIAVARRTAMSGYRRAGFEHFVDTLEDGMLNPGEAWSDRALHDLSTLDEPWHALVRHALTATSAKASAKWQTQGRKLLEEIGYEPARRTLSGWISMVGQPRTVLLEPRAYEGQINEFIDPYNATAIRGIAWLLGLLPEDNDTSRTLAALVEAMLRKVPGHGPRNPKIANSGVYALSCMDGESSVGQLARLASRVTFKGTLKVVNSALDAKAEALGLTRDEVEELSVPGYGLTEVGRMVEKLGEASAEILVDSTVSVLWRNDSGKTVKAPPASVKRDFPDEVKEIKAAAKDITKMLAAQSERLDRQFLAQREWELGTWRERYLDHPLLGTLARRLLWTVDGTPCGFADGELRDVRDNAVEAAPKAPVRLWHPIGRPVEEVVAWRDWLERRQIVQPFKQAHREVYLLTAAEENTEIYSNRFAAHIIRQHQFAALAAARGWHNKLRLMVDDSYTPAYKELPQWGLRAEFWVEGIGDGYGEDTTDAGTYLRLATDQVRFYPIGAPENYAHAGTGGYEQWLRDGADPTQPLPLREIPELVLSEVLRDVDLFVGVASVGNDPTWSDGGPEGRYRDYWQSYSFGELNATAQTRQELLKRLISRLAIADRTTMEGRFLVVRGDLRTYKIHCGSGNILMSPNDEYLCIVPGQVKSGTPGNTGFLPFEGDRVLSVILSKAILLAKDTKITDPTITSQIRTG